MKDIKEFLPYVLGLLVACILVFFFAGVKITFTNMILISLAAVPIKIVCDFFKEF